jgi:hypothetical protein
MIIMMMDDNRCNDLVDENASFFPAVLKAFMKSW